LHLFVDIDAALAAGYNRISCSRKPITTGVAVLPRVRLVTQLPRFHLPFLSDVPQGSICHAVQVAHKLAETLARLVPLVCKVVEALKQCEPFPHSLGKVVDNLLLARRQILIALPLPVFGAPILRICVNIGLFEGVADWSATTVDETHAYPNCEVNLA